MAIGAVAGALSNKKNPLAGAAMGAGMGAMGGAGAGLLGAAGAAGSAGAAGAASGAASGAAGASAAGMSGALGSGISGSLGSALPGAASSLGSGVGGGLLSAGSGVGSGMAGSLGGGIAGASSLPMSGGMTAAASQTPSLMSYAEPIAKVANAANQGASMFQKGESDIPPPAPVNVPMPNNSLGQLATSNTTADLMRQQGEDQKREIRKQMIRRGLV